MKGFVIKIELYGKDPEISRKLIIPEKTTFTELQKIIKKLFTFSNELANGFWTNTTLLSYIDPKNFLVEKSSIRTFILKTDISMKDGMKSA